MPLYEYQCTSCAHRFELIRKFSDPPVEVCPTCGGAVRKLLSSPAIQFKGSGWYITDYSDKRKAARTDNGKAKDAATDGKTETTPPSTGAASASDTSSSKTTDSSPKAS